MTWAGEIERNRMNIRWEMVVDTQHGALLVECRMMKGVPRLRVSRILGHSIAHAAEGAWLDLPSSPADIHWHDAADPLGEAARETIFKLASERWKELGLP